MKLAEFKKIGPSLLGLRPPPFSSVLVIGLERAAARAPTLLP